MAEVSKLSIEKTKDGFFLGAGDINQSKRLLDIGLLRTINNILQVGKESKNDDQALVNMRNDLHRVIEKSGSDANTMVVLRALEDDLDSILFSTVDNYRAKVTTAILNHESFTLDDQPEFLEKKSQAFLLFSAIKDNLCFIENPENLTRVIDTARIQLMSAVNLLEIICKHDEYNFPIQEMITLLLTDTYDGISRLEDPIQIPDGDLFKDDLLKNVLLAEFNKKWLN